MDPSTMSSVRDNAQATNDYYSELTKWEEDIKKEDAKLSSLHTKKPEEKMVICTDENKMTASKCKEEGNLLYGAKQYDAAIAAYTSGISKDDTNHLLYANRAMAYIKLGRGAEAEQDCNKCLQLSANYVKGYLRRSTACILMGAYEKALGDCQKVLELEPSNVDAKKNLQEVQKQLSAQKQATIKNNSPAKKSKQSKTQENTAKQQIQSSSSKVKGNISKGISNSGTVMSPDRDISPPISDYGDSDVMGPIIRPMHLRSQLPLRKLRVTDVSSSCDVPVPQASLTRPPHLVAAKNSSPVSKSSVIDPSVKVEGNTSKSSTNLKKSKSECAPTSSTTARGSVCAAPPVSVAACSDQASLPAVPRTSHQFMTSWTRVAASPVLAYQWLQSIKTSRLEQFELEADCLSSLVGALLSWRAADALPASCGDTALAVATIFSAVASSASFQLNAMFFSDQENADMKTLLEYLQEKRTLTPELDKLLSSLQ